MAGRTATGGLAGVPAVVANAIRTASQKDGVPTDLLAGIWRVESGSSYPNPYENGLGYGGEFGTRMGPAWGTASQTRRIPGGEPPLQDQADTAASILATQIQKSGGNIPAALSAYSGGGYTSVPGEVSFGVISPAGIDPTGASVAGPQAQTRPGGGGSSFWGGLWNDLSGAAGWVEKEGTSAFETAESDAESLIKAPLDFLKAALWLLNKTTWLRAVEAIVGVGLLVGGIVVIANLEKAAAAIAPAAAAL